ncbi:MAG: TetR/AcrR family transcriptional regulator [Halopseudomonas sp.]|uniref:TetR/AcrR family transcriptional regulator n=1 Tax=Halopseudomonas sp. TaxID=2901191 RepID=UPI00300221CA
MTLDERREREKQERRESILDSAETCFFNKGYERTSMDEIARNAHLSRALLYVYFKDKAAIMRGIMLRAGHSLLERFRAAQVAGTNGRQQMQEIGWAYYRFGLERPDYFDVLTNASTFAHLADPDDLSQELACCSELAMACMVESLQLGVSDGSLSAERVGDALQAAYYLRGALHGVIMQSRQDSAGLPNQPEPEKLIGYTIEMLTQSLRG